MITIGTEINTLLIDGQEWFRKGKLDDVLEPIRAAVKEYKQFIADNPEYKEQDEVLSNSLPWKAMYETLERANDVK